MHRKVVPSLVLGPPGISLPGFPGGREPARWSHSWRRDRGTGGPTEAEGELAPGSGAGLLSPPLFGYLAWLFQPDWPRACTA